MEQSQPICPPGTRRAEAGRYDYLLNAEYDYLIQCEGVCSRRRLAEPLRHQGLDRAEADAIVGDYCDRRGILPLLTGYERCLGAVALAVMILGFVSGFFLIGAGEAAVRHSIYPHDHAWRVHYRYMTEGCTTIFITGGIDFVLFALMVSLNHFRRKRVQADVTTDARNMS